MKITGDEKPHSAARGVTTRREKVESRGLRKNNDGAIAAEGKKALIISPRKSDRGLYVYQARPRANSAEPSRFYEI